jgi:hypothetical protein
MKSKPLFITSAVIEGGTGLALLVAPALVVSILIDAPLDTPAGLTVSRVAGAGLLALGLACWLARNDEHSRAAMGIVSAMLFYNVATVVVLTYAAIGWRMSGVGLWPAVVFHGGMGVWCLASLRVVFSDSLEKPGAVEKGQ